MDSYDGVEKLRLGELPDPEPAHDQVLLRMTFAALNPADAFLAKKMYPANPQLPHVLGRDGVGDVLAVGSEVRDVQVGDTVGLLRCDAGVESWGTLAELTVVPAASVARIPQGWSAEQMAAAPLVFLTAWQALTMWSDPPAPPREGSVLLVTGASGGVGVASVLLGTSLKLTVVGLSRSTGKAARLKELGAHAVFDPAATDLRRSVSAAIAPRKVDLAIDNVGSELFNQVIAMLGYGGRVSVVGRSGGPVPSFNTATLLFRRNRIGGVAVGDYTPESAHAAWTEIVSRLQAIGARPVVDSIFAFSDVKAAFARLAEGPMGKVVVRVGKEYQ